MKKNIFKKQKIKTQTDSNKNRSSNHYKTGKKNNNQYSGDEK